MVPESTLDELETATVAAHYCVTCIVCVKSKIVGLRGDVDSTLFAETICEPARRLLEGYRALRAALKPHVERDFVGVCGAPVEIGGMFSTSAHNSVFTVSNRVLHHLSFVLMPAGFWPSSEDPETDLLADLRMETPVEVSENAVMALRVVFDELSHKELSKCTAMVGREWATARAIAGEQQKDSTKKGTTAKELTAKKKKGQPRVKEDLTGNQEKCASAIWTWHGFELNTLSCKNYAAVSSSELARLAGVRKGNATTEFFKWWFPKGGNAEYKRLCKFDDCHHKLAKEIARLSDEGRRFLNEKYEKIIESKADPKAKHPGDDIDD